MSRPPLPELVARAQELRAAGIPRPEVAAELGTTPRTVDRWVRVGPAGLERLATGEASLQALLDGRPARSRRAVAPPPARPAPQTVAAVLLDPAGLDPAVVAALRWVRGRGPPDDVPGLPEALARVARR